MSSLLTEALSLCNLAAVGIFGIVLSAAFCEIEWTRRHKLLLMGCTILMLALQGVVSLRWGTGLAGISIRSSPICRCGCCWPP